MSQYLPKPVDTSRVPLNDDVTSRIEILARNVHDNWALLKMDEGWTYASVQDDEKKTTPQLVSYDELSDASKDYDRKTVIETLKYLELLGFSIGCIPQEGCGENHDNPR